MRRRATLVATLSCLGAVAVATAPSASAATRDVWVAAMPAPTWNMAPNERDGITGMPLSPSTTVFPTVVYRRMSKGWKHTEANAPAGSSNQDLIPGPLIRAQTGDRLRIHFKNMDTLYDHPHSMHFHGVHYKPSSDGAYVPGFSGKDANVKFGQSYTYVLHAGEDSAGVWPYHDHSPSMMDSIQGGMYGALSVLGRHERKPDREFVVFLESMAGFMTIDGRAFIGNTPVFHARVGDLVQWDVLTLGDDHHTFHVHGHRWLEHGTPVDVQTVGPAESFKIRWREDRPGTWYYHCHVESHMANGMIGLYRVSRR